MVTIHTMDEEAGVRVSAELRQQGYNAQYASHYTETLRGEWYSGDTEHEVTVQLCHCRKNDDHPGGWLDYHTEWYD